MATVVIKTATLAMEVKRKRMGLHYRQRGLRSAALLAGITAATMSRVELGRMVDLLTYAKLCDWLGCSLDRFVERPPWQAAIE